MAQPQAHATLVSTRRAVADVGVQLGGQVVNLALGIVTTVVLVRSLSATRYGEWATLLATTELVALAGNLGLENVAVRYATQEPEREGAWIGAATSLQMLISIPLGAASIGVIALIANDQEMFLAGLVISFLFVTGALATLRVAFRLHVRNHIVVAFTTVNSAIWAGLVIAISASDGGLVAYALAFAGVALLTQGTMAIYALHTIAVRWRGAHRLWGPLARVGISVGVAGALTISYGRIDQLLVYQLTPNPADVGIYAAMYKILDNAGFVPLAIMTTLFPIMAGIVRTDPQRLRRLMQMAVDYLSIVALGALALTLAASGPIVELLFGADYASGASILPVLFLAFVPICIGTVAGNMVIATDLQRRYIWYALLGLLLNVPLNILLIPHYGIVAAAWITVLTEFVVVGLAMRVVLRRIEMRLSLRRLLLATAAAGASGLVVWGLRHAGAGALLLVATMAVVYPPMLLALRALNLGELRSLVRSRQSGEVA